MFAYKPKQYVIINEINTYSLTELFYCSQMNIGIARTICHHLMMESPLVIEREEFYNEVFEEILFIY